MSTGIIFFANQLHCYYHHRLSSLLPVEEGLTCTFGNTIQHDAGWPMKAKRYRWQASKIFYKIENKNGRKQS